MVWGVREFSSNGLSILISPWDRGGCGSVGVHEATFFRGRRGFVILLNVDGGGSGMANHDLVWLRASSASHL